jgi:excisionase family DNA binding protein
LTPVPRLYTTEEVAEILKVNIKTVRNLIADRKLIAIQLGREYRISEDRLMEFLKENETK